MNVFFFFFQAEDGIRDVERSRGSEMCIRDRTTGVSNRNKLQRPRRGRKEEKERLLKIFLI